MARISRAARALSALAAFALWTACGPSNGGTQSSRVQPIVQPDDSFVRFINGSPDSSGAGTLTVSARSGQFATVDYAKVTPFIAFTRGINAEFVISSPAWTTPLTCTTPYALVPAGHYTIVVSGSATGVGNQRLQCQLFGENFIVPGSGQFQMLFHHASPATYLAGQATLVTGTFTPASGTDPVTMTFAGSATFTTIFAGPASSSQTTVAAPTASFQLQGVTAQPGIGFFVNPSPTPAPPATPTPTPLPPGATPTPTAVPGATPTPTPSPEATALPANALLGAGNPGSLPDPFNFFPVALTTTFSLYVVDAPAGSSPPGPPFRLVGVFD